MSLWIIALISMLCSLSLSQADTIWTGAGANKNWSTAENWSAGLPGSQNVLFKNQGSAATAATVTSIVDEDYTIGSLIMDYEAPVGANTTTYQNLQINSGKVLTVNGGLSVGSTTETAYTSNFNYINYLTLGGSGALIMNGGGTANLTVLPTNTGTLQPRYRRAAVLDMQTLASFTANNLSEFVLGADQNSSSSITSQVNLAVNNTIQASRLVMQGYFGQSYLQLGTTNKLYIDDILIGQQDTTSPTQTWSGGAATMRFRSGVTGATVEIRAKDGVGAANIVVGRSGLAPAAGAGGTGEGYLNLEGGTMDAKVNNFIIGLADQGTTSLVSGAAVTGTATLGAGLMEAANVVVGRTTTGNTNTNNGVTALANLIIKNGGTLDVSEELLIGDAQQSTLALTSTVYLTSGTLKASSINTGANAANNKSVAFNWNSGTTIQNHAGSDLTIGAGVPLTLTGTGVHTFNIDSAKTGAVNSDILSAAGVGGVTKTGLGKLKINSTGNTYTGATVVTAGTLEVDGSIVSSSVVTVNNGGTLIGTGDVSAIILNEGGIIGDNSLTATSFTWNGNLISSVGQLQYDLNTLVEGLTLTGTLTKGTGTYFTFDFLGTGELNMSYTLLNGWTSTNFDEANFSYVNLGGGLSGTFTIVDNALMFTTVPEPSVTTLCLVAFAFATLIARCRVSQQKI